MIRQLLLAVALCAAGIAQAADATRVAKYMQVSGLDDAVDNIPQSLMGNLLDGLQVFIPTADAEAMARRHLDPVAMRRHIADSLGKSSPDAEIDAMLGFLSSPLGLKITALEAHANRERAGLEAMMAAVRPLFGDESRILLSQRLDRAAGLTDFAVEIALGSVIGALLHNGRIPADNPGYQLAVDDINTRYRAQMHTQIQQQMIFSMLYTYRSLPIAELQQYVEFLEQAPTKNANALILAAMHDDLTRGIPSLVAELAGQLEKQAATGAAAPTPGAAPANAPAPAALPKKP